MSNDDLGPRPDPVIEDKEPNPGGADAIPDDDDNLARDLHPEDNPAVDDVLPDEIAAEGFFPERGAFVLSREEE